MLKMLSEQGVDTVIATPHFYMGNIELNDFLKIRAQAADILRTKYSDTHTRPRIALGAEVEFYNELYSFEHLEKLCISGTRYILIEMPFNRWSDYTYQSLSYLALNRNVIPIIAHIERYLDFQKDDVIDKLIDADALIQINGSFILEKNTRRKALSMIKKGMVCYLGSDCHNLNDRRPNLGDAYSILRRKVNKDDLDTFEYWESQLKESLEAF